MDEPGGSYWSSWLEFIRKQLLKQGLICPEDLSLFKITDDIDEAAEEIMGFYSVYNSTRSVRGKLVLRLHAEPGGESVERLNDEFGEIIESGRIEKAGMHRLEIEGAGAGRPH